MALVVKPTDVVCPKCEAKPGKKCRTMTTNRSTDTHEARRAKYGETMRWYR